MEPHVPKPRRVAVLFIAVCLVTAACNLFVPAPWATISSVTGTAVALDRAAPTDVPTVVAVLNPTPNPTSPSRPTLVPTPTVAASPTVTPTPYIEPLGCQRPPDDYSRLVINGSKLNYRTFWMLRHAKTLYKATIDFTGSAITQGSFNPGGVTASFGTHDAGGAVDIAVINMRTGAVLRDELPQAIRALRIAGFAAWVREANELYRGSPIHIHAIAIGDKELSPAASQQLTGTFGYFRGFNGLPQQNNVPIPDRHGGPILCQWMIDMGYRDMRGPQMG
jgi:hypothetical protein